MATTSTLFKVSMMTTATTTTTGQEDIRIFSIPSEEVNWNSLYNKLRASFGSSQQKLVVKYLDEDEDLISCSSDDELQLALEFININKAAKCLRLFVSVIDDNQQNGDPVQNYQPAVVKVGQDEANHEAVERSTEVAELTTPNVNDQPIEERKKSPKKKRTDTHEETEKPRRKGGKRHNNNNKGQSSEEERAKRQEEKLKRREENLKQREQSKAERQLKKKQKEEDKEKAKESSKRDLEDWPSHVDRLFLDGNNMLYLSPAIRHLALPRSNAWKAELLLEGVANDFIQYMNGQVQNGVLIFDSTKTNKVNTLSNGTTLEVKSARPHFNTSDEALVKWAKDNQVAAGKSMFVTSDRELTRLLKEASAGMVVKPKAFLLFAMNVVSKAKGEATEELDAWLHCYSPAFSK